MRIPLILMINFLMCVLIKLLLILKKQGISLCCLALSSSLYLLLIVYFEMKIHDEFKKSIRAAAYQSGFVHRYTQVGKKRGFIQQKIFITLSPQYKTA